MINSRFLRVHDTQCHGKFPLNFILISTSLRESCHGIMNSVCKIIMFPISFPYRKARKSPIFHSVYYFTQALKDWHLVLIALVITAVGTLLSVLQVAVPILQPVPYYATNHEPPSAPMNVSVLLHGNGLFDWWTLILQELGLRVEEMVAFCFNSTLRPISGAWIVLTFIYLAILQLIGVILALRTRKVKIKALKNAKYIVAAIYISAIALMIIAVSTFAIGNLPNVIELLFSGSLMVATTVFLSMVFIPKVSNSVNSLSEF